MWKFQTLAFPELPLLLINFVIWQLNYQETNSASLMIVHLGVFLKASFASGGKRNTHLLFKYPGCNLHAIHGWKRVEIDWLVTLCDRYEPYGRWYKIIVNSVKWTTSSLSFSLRDSRASKTWARVKIIPLEKGKMWQGDFHACLHITHSTIAEGKWGTIPSPMVKWNMNQWSKLKYFQHHLLVL